MRQLLRSLAVISALALPLVAHADTFTGTASFTDTDSNPNNFYNFTGSFANSPFTFTGGTGFVYLDNLTITTNNQACRRGCFNPSDQLSVTVNFTQPGSGSGSFSGNGSDFQLLTFFGVYNGTDINWLNNTQTVTFGDGSSVLITLPNLNYDGFGDGTSGVDPMTIKVLTSPAATPEPSSLMLLGTGIVGAAGIVRRRIAA